MNFKSLFVLLFASIVVISTGCTPDTTPTGPEDGALQNYLDENPEQAAMEDEVEPDDGSDDGTGE